MAMLAIPRSRRRAVSRLVRYLQQYQAPRIQLLLVLTCAGAVGIGASYLLLRVGLEQMWLRYPLSAFVGYGSFLVGLRYWAQHQVSRPELLAKLEVTNKRPKGSKRGTWSDTWLFDVCDVLSVGDDLPVAALVFLAIILVVVLVWLVVAGPVLLAEALLDALLMAGLYHRFMTQGSVQTMGGALRSTIMPAVIVIASLALIGFLLHVIDPSARSIGDVFARS